MVAIARHTVAHLVRYTVAHMAKHTAAHLASGEGSQRVADFIEKRPLPARLTMYKLASNNVHSSV